MKTYLPELSDDALRENLLNPSSAFLAALSGQEFERLGIDRALLIASDIMLRTGRCEEFAILDAGCNNGLIGHCLKVLGNHVTGIDSNLVSGQNLYAPLREIVEYDFYDYLCDTSCLWDYVLLLSVAHHWPTGYAMSGAPVYSSDRIHEIFSILKNRVRGGIYMEMPLSEPGFESDFTDRFMPEYCSAFDVVEINRTVATNGVLRRLYYLGAVPENRNPRLETLLRMAHLWEKMETDRLRISRAEYFACLSGGKKLPVQTGN